MSSEEFEGIVKFVNDQKEFGVIYTPEREYYFKKYELKNKVAVGDSVRFLTKLKNSTIVATCVRKIFVNAHNIRFISRIKSHLHEGVEEYLHYILNQVKDVDKEYIVEQMDFPRPVGLCNCIPTTEHDSVYYGIRENRLGHSRFVENKTAIETNSITIVLKRVDGFYSIITGYLGEKSGVEPFDERATDVDLRFWSSHAFIHGTEPILDGSLTRENPWILSKSAICKLRTSIQTINAIGTNQLILRK